MKKLIVLVVIFALGASGVIAVSITKIKNTESACDEIKNGSYFSCKTTVYEDESLKRIPSGFSADDEHAKSVVINRAYENLIQAQRALNDSKSQNADSKIIAAREYAVRQWDDAIKWVKSIETK